MKCVHEANQISKVMCHYRVKSIVEPVQCPTFSGLLWKERNAVPAGCSALRDSWCLAWCYDENLSDGANHFSDFKTKCCHNCTKNNISQTCCVNPGAGSLALTSRTNGLTAQCVSHEILHTLHTVITSLEQIWNVVEQRAVAVRQYQFIFDKWNVFSRSQWSVLSRVGPSCLIRHCQQEYKCQEGFLDKEGQTVKSPDWRWWQIIAPSFSLQTFRIVVKNYANSKWVIRRHHNLIIA